MTEQENNIQIYQRQRRNLFLVGFALLTLECADVRLDTLSLQGYLFKVGNPDFIFWALIVLLLYFTWRDYQYYYICYSGAFKNRVNYLLRTDASCMNHAIRSLLASSDDYSFLRGDVTVKLLSSRQIKPTEDGLTIEDAEIQFLNSDGSEHSRKKLKSVEFNQKGLRAPRRRAQYIAFFDTPEFTEHYLPFIFSAFVLLISVFGKMYDSNWYKQLLIYMWH